MNLNDIEKFAVRARRNLTAGVEAALSRFDITAELQKVQGGWVYRGEIVEDIEFGLRWAKLKDIISREGREVAIERAAYTWFNRLVAIRILAKRGIIPPQLEWADRVARVPRIVHRMRTGAGTPNLTPGEDAALAHVRSDPTKTLEQFALLVGAFCRETPMLKASFGGIDDWTQLLIPANLLVENGLVDDLNNPELLSDADYESDELIGWLYQYYIAERKAQVYDDFKKNKKAGVAEIPAATQIFTPNWIAKYLVENTLKNADENTRFIDPCCGSGHMLLEAFRKFLAIYEELGYSKKSSIEQIFERNLTGVDIDPRARQLSTFSLLLAAVKEDEWFKSAKSLPRVFDTSTPLTGEGAISYNIPDIVSDALDTKNKTAINEISGAIDKLKEVGDNIGSLLKLDLAPETLKLIELRLGDVEDNELSRVLGLILALTGKYDALVTNPPYLGAGNLNTELKQYLEKHYKDGKSDLFAAFILRLLDLCNDGGRVGMITMQSWMFLSSFEALRERILDEATILTMAHLGAHAFDSIGGEVTQTTAFVLANEFMPDYKGEYYRLVDGRCEAEKEEKYKVALSNDKADHVSAANFKKIPGLPIAYWVGEKMIKVFATEDNFSKNGQTTKGIITGDNGRFMRLWWEVSNDEIAGEILSISACVESKRKWFYCAKGGHFRRWFGNDDTVINWYNDGYEVMHPTPTESRHCQDYYSHIKFKDCISWSSISSGEISFRYKKGCLIDHAGMAYAPNSEDYVYWILGFANSKVSSLLLSLLSPTLNYNAGEVDKLPIIEPSKRADDIIIDLITLSRSDWDEYETSWDFKVNPLVREGWQRGGEGMKLEDAWKAVFARRMEWAERMKALEEENNRLFIEAYGLQDELKPDVEWKEVSITGNPFYRYKVNPVSSANGTFGDDSRVKVPPMLEAKARADAIKELLSYGMGVLMGRYSLEQEGLILASQGELYKDYFAKVHGAGKVLPDDDGVIPAIMLEGNFFADNLLHRMREFLSAAFGNNALPGNLNFIETALGGSFDKYLVDKLFGDHVKTYKKRPIYWLFESPKGSFKAFAYMHRMTGATAGHIRNKYLLPYIAHLEKCFGLEVAKGSSMTSAERKRVKALEAAIADCKNYDYKLHEFADRAIAIDLDDGVVVNWKKYESVLAKI